MAEKKIPMRMCIACREMKEKRELLRIVKTADGIKVDKTGKLSGRGANICSSPDCASKLVKGKLLNRAFETAVSDETYQAVLKELTTNEE